MILYYTGTGNSEYVAKKIGEKIGDQVVNLFDRIKNKDYSSLESSKMWVIVCPTYAWRIPRVVKTFLLNTDFKGSKDICFVMTCGDGIGNAGKYSLKICQKKNLNYKGTARVVMPENYIALYNAPGSKEANEIITKAESVIENVASCILDNKNIDNVKVTQKFYSSTVNPLFYTLIVKDKKFNVNDSCISCGICEKSCPMGNIKLQNGKPTWNGNCTHCMACICKCPKEAIEYGEKSKGKVRYTCPK